MNATTVAVDLAKSAPRSAVDCRHFCNSSRADAVWPHCPRGAVEPYLQRGDVITRVYDGFHQDSETRKLCAAARHRGALSFEA